MAMSGTRKTLIIIGSIVVGLVLVVLIGLAVLVAAFRDTEPAIAQNSVLSLRVAGFLPDYVPDDPVRKLLGGTDQSLSKSRRAIQKSEGRQSNQGNHSAD